MLEEYYETMKYALIEFEMNGINKYELLFMIQSKLYNSGAAYFGC